MLLWSRIPPRGRRGHVALLPALLVAVLVLAVVLPAGAQTSKEFHWRQYDYDVEILDNGDTLFTVVMTFSFDRGSFSQGYYAFELGRVDDVRDVQVWEGNQQYRPVGSEAVGGYQVNRTDEIEVLWWFPPTAGGERTFTLQYRVVGGLRIYEGGDQFFWHFYAGDRPARIERGVITVHLPGAVAPEQLRVAADPETVGLQQLDDSTIRATVTGFPANRQATLRIQFPHGMVQARPPAWQAADDRRIAYEETWKPVVELGVLGLSILTLFGGVGAVVALWYSRGRDKPVGLVAEYLSEPPSGLQPALAGILVDEKADVRDIIATIVDLGRRGVMTIEEVEEKAVFGLSTKKDFIYRLEKRASDLLGYEQSLLKELFGSGTEKRLSALKERFYTAIPRITKEMYAELAGRQYFAANPEHTRNKWRGLAVGGLVLAGILFFCGVGALSQYASTLFCLPAALGVVFVALLIVAGHMPRRTELGAEETAKWKAFRRYLEDIDRYDDLEEKAAIFENYLPYAIAFGMEKDYIKKFSRVPTPAPQWYRPYPPIIIMRGGGMDPVPGGSTSTPGGGFTPPTLQGMSDGMSSSLQSMSDGLVTMLNSASNTLTSAPRSSGSGGGGGWSGGGGGFGGGGGGGGGSGAR